MVLVDTAGRLHNKAEPDERAGQAPPGSSTGSCPAQPKEIAAGAGRHHRAERPHPGQAVQGDAPGITGIVLTKLDGTAKGGIVIAIAQELGVPVKFVGLGEGIDDLQPFDAVAFAEALV